jgi:hypothetical protein
MTTAAFDIRDTLDWDAFVAEHWERRVVKIVRGAGPFEAGDVLAAAVAAGERVVEDHYDASARRTLIFSVEGRLQSHLRRWLPAAGDGSLIGYARRIAPALDERRHALIVNSLHSYSLPLWTSERALLSQLWRRVGLPLSGAITTLFHGDYEATPTGVHKDRFTTFLFAVHGRKRMRFWPQRPWSEPVATISDYRRYLDSSFTVEVEPGDILYWPSSYYHVGESCGGVATSVNIGIPRDEHLPVYYLDDILLGTIDEVDLSEAQRGSGLLHGERGAPLAPGPRPDGTLGPELPLAWQSALRRFRAISQPRALARRRRSLWLARLLAAGLEPPPAGARELLELAPRRRRRR